MSENLIEPEGVNSTTDNTMGDGESSPRAGGHPSQAPDSAMETDQDPTKDEAGDAGGGEMVGTTEVSEGGQDEGSSS